MATLHIDHESEADAALISVCSDTTESQWSAVRRFFEERCSETANRGPRSLSVPWWSFLALRDGLRFVLRYNGVDRIVASADAELILQAAARRATQFRDSARAPDVLTEGNLLNRLRVAGFTRQLKQYQVRNVLAMLRLPAAATFSVPGAGKTSEALALYFASRGDSDRLLVVAPKNAFAAWEEELEACVPSTDMRFVRLVGGLRAISELLRDEPSAMLLSYHQLPRILTQIGGWLRRFRTYMFVDESHRIKRGADGVHGSCILQLSYLPVRKLIMSGTPMPNARADLLPQFSFLYPEVPTSETEVVAALQHVFVRTTKGELGLPAPTRVAVSVELAPAQRQLYEVLRSDVARKLVGLNVHDRLHFRAFARSVQHLLQVVSNPALLARSSLQHHELLRAAIAEGLAPKVAEACRIARRLSARGQKTLIWTTFVDNVEHIAALLSDLGAEYIHGGVDTSEDDEVVDSREAKLRRFKDPDSGCRVLVANPAACAEGISLHHVCHHALYVDRNYNAAQYLQSEDRIHRLGLPPDAETVITILTAPGTIDESVQRRLVAKVQAMSDVLNDPGLSITPIDLEDAGDGFEAADLEDLRSLLLGSG